MTVSALVFLGSPVAHLPTLLAGRLLGMPPTAIVDLHDARQAMATDRFSRITAAPASISYIEYATALDSASIGNLIAQSIAFGKSIVLGHGDEEVCCPSLDLLLQERISSAFAVGGPTSKFVVLRTVWDEERLRREARQAEEGRRRPQPSVFPGDIIVLDAPPTTMAVG